MANVETMNTTDKQTELRTRIKSFRSIRKKPLPPVTPFNIKGLFQGVVFFLPIIYILIYTIGFMNYIGYLDAYNLDSVEFQIPVDSALLLGVIALLPGLKYGLVLPLLLTIYLVLVMLLLLVNKPMQKTISWMMKKVSKIPRPKKPSAGDLASIKGLLSQADISITLSVQLFTCFFIAFIPVLIGYISMQLGTKEAHQQQQKFLSSETHNVYESSKLMSPPYMRVVCNNIHCAFWNKEGTLLLRHDQVQKIHFVPENKEK